MSAFAEAQYTIDEVLKGINQQQVTGIPPLNAQVFVVKSDDSKVKIRVQKPENTIVNDQLLCTCEGILVVRKTGSAPTSIDDGTTIIDYKGSDVYSYEDTGLTNGITYYYRAFPYSDHGVYNYNEENTKSVSPSATKYWAFDEDFSNKNPDTRISYPDGYQNSDFNPMITNIGYTGGTPTDGGWLDFLQNTLKNYPYMVRKNGKVDYALDPSDYTKKLDGTASDYNNTSYDGGAFAWINKIWVKEEYSGTKRRVIFCDHEVSGFYPMGFLDPDNNELEGIWIPMGYMDANGRTLVAGTTPVASKPTDQERTIIQSFSVRAHHLGGPILTLLRDLEIMMYKNTDIQKVGGHGRCNAGSQAVVANQVVANGVVPGFYGNATKTTMNKAFHSQVLFSYQQWLRDPYNLLVNNVWKASKNYTYDLTGAAYTDTGIRYTAGNGWVYPSTKVFGGEGIGSLPKDENTGSTSTGHCDGVYKGTVSGVKVLRRLSATNNDLSGGPDAWTLYHDASNAYWDNGVGLVLLPSVGYSPE